MQRRLVLVLSLFSLVAVAFFAYPLLELAALERTQRFVLIRTTDLERFASLAEPAINNRDPMQLDEELEAHHSLYGEGVVIVDRSGRAVSEVGLGLTDPGVSAAADAALRNATDIGPDLMLGPWSDDPVLLGRPVGTGTGVAGAVVMRASTASAAADVAAAWWGVLTRAVLLAVVCVALALLVARWVARPVGKLTRGIRAIAAGRPGRPIATDEGPTELRELAAAFNRMSGAVAISAEQQQRLVADTSHQLRNPLAALRLRVDVLEMHLDEQAHEAYTSTVAELDRLESLLDDMLDLASAESRATEAAAGVEDGRCSESCEVSAAVTERLEVWEPLAEQAGVRLQASVGASPAEAAISASELAQVLDVLVDNAVKYGGEGSTVAVGYRSTLEGLVLWVRDDGPGLAPEDLARATERFWRSRDARPERGSGLGLAIADRIADSRGGSLTLEAGPQGRGLMVTLRLPLATA